jgi:fructose 1,6-bisphosphatase
MAVSTQPSAFSFNLFAIFAKPFASSAVKLGTLNRKDRKGGAEGAKEF